MKNLKKTVWILLCAASIALAGCGNSNAVSKDSAAAKDATTAVENGWEEKAVVAAGTAGEEKTGEAVGTVGEEKAGAGESDNSEEKETGDGSLSLF